MAISINNSDQRSLADAMWKGALCRCPKCGKGKLYHAYLKVNDHCPNCGEALFHQRAQDFPPYIAITIVGHVLVAIMLHMEMSYHISPVVYLYTLLPLAVILPLMILPSVKGATIGMQWANRMHGFDSDQDDRLSADKA